MTITAPKDTNPLATIMAGAKAGGARGPAPVHLWNPPFCGDIDIEIRRDGSWWHEGRPIRRAGMAQLFASILLYEGDEYFLVTPAEKVRIRVEDCPFLVTDMDVEQKGDPSTQAITLHTSLGEVVTIDPEHPLCCEAKTEPHPTVVIRSGLTALLSRAVYYRLAELAQAESDADDAALGVWSCGQFFALL